MLLGRYELLNKIATGGMADVFEARQWGDAHLERRVVVKRLHAELASDRSALVDLKNEAAVLASLNVRGVPSLIDFRCMGGVWFIVMELVRGPTLRQLMDHGISTDAKLAVLAGLSQVLAEVHEAADGAGKALGVVHGDITPRNVVINGAGQVCLVDFGLARFESEPAPEGTRGTTGYFAPEALNRDAAYDRRADLFSLAALSGEVLSGVLPFDASSVPAYLSAVDAQRVKSGFDVSALGDGAGPLQQCLAATSAHRPSGVPALQPHFGPLNAALLARLVQGEFAGSLTAPEAAAHPPGFVVALPAAKAPEPRDERRLSMAERTELTSDLAFFAPDEDPSGFEFALEPELGEPGLDALDAVLDTGRAAPAAFGAGAALETDLEFDAPELSPIVPESPSSELWAAFDSNTDAAPVGSREHAAVKVADEYESSGSWESESGSWMLDNDEAAVAPHNPNSPTKAPKSRRRREKKKSRGVTEEIQPDLESGQQPASEEHGAGFYIYVDED